MPGVAAADNVALLDEPKPNAALFRSIATVMLGSICYGVDVQIAGAVADFESFREDWCVGNFGTADECTGDAILENSSWQNVFLPLITYLITIGMAFGAILAGPVLTGRLGRRACVSVGGVLTFLGAILTAYLTFGSIFMMYLSRFITGLGVGTCCFAIPMYNSEIATPKLRGTTGGLYQISVNIGQLIASGILAIITDMPEGWKLGTFLPGIAGLVVACLVWTVPESPRYVMQKHGYEAGLAILSKVRGGDAVEEARSIEQKLNEEKDLPTVTYTEMFTNKSLRNRVFVAVYLQIAQQFTAINVYLGLWSTVAGHMCIDNANSFMFIITLVMFAGTCISVGLIDTKLGGRKMLLLIACLVMLPAQLVSGFAAMQHCAVTTNKASLLVYSFGFALAWGTVAWVLPSELFSMIERGPALGLSTFAQFVFNPIVGFPSAALMTFNFAVCMFAFSALQVTNIVYVLGAVKETRGVPLEDVPALYDGTLKKGAFA